MQNPEHESTRDLGESWDSFELQLRARSLGAGPARRGEVLYECGYAAGLTAGRHALRHSIRRWRLVGIAATIFAMGASTIHFLPVWKDEVSRSVAKRDGQSVAERHNGPGFSQPPSSWLQLLERERRSSSSTGSALRASASLLAIHVGTDVAMHRDAAPFSIPGAPLTPSDFPQLLIEGESR